MNYPSHQQLSTTMTYESVSEKKRMHRSWSFYDWSNSVYNLVITSTIFPAYYEGITSVRENGIIVNDQINILGWQVTNTSLFNYAVALAYLIIVILSPILSSIADIKGNKLQFMKLFCYLGAAACCGMYYFEIDTLVFGMICFILATVGFCGSLVFYNSYLPEIAEMDERDKLSAQGFAYGYIGSVILQLICFVFVMKPEWWGQEDAIWGSRFSFLLVGLWWMLFAQIPFKALKKVPNAASAIASKTTSIFTHGFKQIFEVYKDIKRYRNLRVFLAAFFFYSMGVQTVMLAATLFGSKTLNLATEQLIITILLIQLVAIIGSYLMSFLSTKWGNIVVLMITVVVWIAICMIAYVINSATEFYALACLVGLVMGGIQSLSRSTYAKLIPEGVHNTTSYFSFYDITEKIAIVLGMVTFGVIEDITSSMRNSIFALIIFFIIGLVLLYICHKSMKKPATN